MLEPRIVAARTHRAVAGLQGDGSVAWRMASSQGPLARTLIADTRSLDYSPLIAGRERGTRERSMNHAKSVTDVIVRSHILAEDRIDIVHMGGLHWNPLLSPRVERICWDSAKKLEKEMS
jgi:hypothetical protein